MSILTATHLLALLWAPQDSLLVIRGVRGYGERGIREPGAVTPKTGRPAARTDSRVLGVGVPSTGGIIGPDMHGLAFRIALLPPMIGGRIQPNPEASTGLRGRDVMRPAGHSKYETTYRFYLQMKDGLTDRARNATRHTVSRELLQKCCSRGFEGDNGKG